MAFRMAFAIGMGQNDTATTPEDKVAATHNTYCW